MKLTHVCQLAAARADVRGYWSFAAFRPGANDPSRLGSSVWPGKGGCSQVRAALSTESVQRAAKVAVPRRWP
jgi:hypothetical protein